MKDNIRSAIKDKILDIRLERQHKKNALTEKMYMELSRLISEASDNTDVNVILISGGQDFTAGNDLNDFIQNPPTDANSPVFQFMLALTNCPLPIVAAVDGFAVGIGTTMLLHCDLVYASKSSIFMLPFINLGLVPEFASSQLLEKRTGYLKAAEMLMLGNKFDAKTALEYRLINQICESEELLRLAVDSAEKLATKPRESLIITKSLMRRETESITDRIEFEAQHFIEFLNKSSTKEIINKLGKK
ncbi:MAG: enoyl-CoA hydratase [Euryarchaeota archaeon]|nr:enoyl-CoA hydratase [Euryarchaeota archaeon]|tara:strand:- start:2657 stop:3394 length:738 start_codon:yes stop_codon:yes gene_type:complete